MDLPRCEDGEPRQTCVADEAEGEGRRRKPPSGVARKALQMLADLILTEGRPIQAGALKPANTQGVREERWRAECDARRLSLAEDQKDRDRVFRRAAKDLQDVGEIAMRDGSVWMLGGG